MGHGICIQTGRMKNEITIGKPKAVGIIESDYYVGINTEGRKR